MTVKATAARIGIGAIAIAAAGTIVSTSAATATGHETTSPRNAAPHVSAGYAQEAGIRVEFKNNTNESVAITTEAPVKNPNWKWVAKGGTIAFENHSSTGTDISDAWLYYPSTKSMIAWEANDPTVGKVGVTFDGTKYGVSAGETKSGRVSGHPFTVERTDSHFIGYKKTLNDTISVYRYNVVVNLT